MFPFTPLPRCCITGTPAVAGRASVAGVRCMLAVVLAMAPATAMAGPADDIIARVDETVMQLQERTTNL